MMMMNVVVVVVWYLVSSNIAVVVEMEKFFNMCRPNHRSINAGKEKSISQIELLHAKAVLGVIAPCRV